MAMSEEERAQEQQEQEKLDLFSCPACGGLVAFNQDKCQCGAVFLPKNVQIAIQNTRINEPKPIICSKCGQYNSHIIPECNRCKSEELFVYCLTCDAFTIRFGAPDSNNKRLCSLCSLCS